ncbi:MAG: 7TM diverse intracellular signaling domain-containing protein [Flavobacteriales bacterium]
MKSFISTLLLCLIVSIFSLNTKSFAANLKSAPIHKKTENKKVSSKKTNNKATKYEDISIKTKSLKSIEKNKSKETLSTNTRLTTKNIVEENSYKKNNVSSYINLSFSNGIYYGFVIAIIFLNLICFFLFEERLFLYYSFTLIASLGVFLLYDEIINLNASFYNFEHLKITFLTIAIGLNILFSSKYLSLEKEFPKLKDFTIPLFIITSAFVLLSWFYEDSTIKMIIKTLLFSIFCVYFFVGVWLFHSKNYAKFYTIAIAIPLLFAIDFFVLKAFGIGFLFTKIIHLKVSTLIEMLILTFGIVYKLQVVKEEIEIKKTEMQLFVKQKNLLSRNSIESMVEDIYLENLILQYDLDGLEIKLLQYISEGKSNEKICRKLKLSEKQLEDLTLEVYKKLEIKEQIKEDYHLVNQQPDYIYN